MYFHSYKTTYDRVRDQKLTTQDFRSWVNNQKAVNKNTYMSHRCWLEELEWVENHRPYYDVYPSIVPMLLKVDLDKVDATHIKFPVPRLCVRFAEPVVFGTESLKCLLVSKISMFSGPGLAVWCDFGYDYVVWQAFKLDGNIGAQLKVANNEHCESSIPEDTLRSCVQLVVSLSLIEEIIEPELLNSDARSTQPMDLLIDRAHRRGKIGWSVGKGVEMCPHLRRPHLGIRWTGPRSSVPKIVPIKGSIIHKSAVLTIPTGTM
jgi:hypothetical protein